MMTLKMMVASIVFVLTACHTASTNLPAVGAGATSSRWSSWPAAPSRYKVLYGFAGGTDGAAPFEAGLIDISGTLYGTTSYGGGSACYSGAGCGTVFQMSTDGRESVVYGFTGGADGVKPQAGLTAVNGALYGTTATGGGSKCFSGLGCGTIFEVTKTGTEKVLHRFAGGSHGYTPLTGLLDANGMLYGTTAYGGSSNNGTIYRIDPTGSGFKTLYSFAGGSDGAGPRGDLINVKGSLYGTTVEGGGSGCYGAFGCGTIFRVSTTGVEKVMHRFGGGSDAAYPQTRLLDLNGTLYGVTYEGGGSGCFNGYGCGTAFRIGADGAQYKVLHKFGSGSDGVNPVAGLVEVNGTLYGTTYGGGSASAAGGTVFRISTTGAEKVLHNFGTGSDGVNPTARLLDFKGRLYSTTVLGGTARHGTVFEFVP